MVECEGGMKSLLCWGSEGAPFLMQCFGGGESAPSENTLSLRAPSSSTSLLKRGPPPFKERVLTGAQWFF